MTTEALMQALAELRRALDDLEDSANQSHFYLNAVEHACGLTPADAGAHRTQLPRDHKGVASLMPTGQRAALVLRVLQHVEGAVAAAREAQAQGVWLEHVICERDSRDSAG